MNYLTTSTTEIRFATRTYAPGTFIQVLSYLVHDGVCLCQFPGGEETYVAAWRLENPPRRKEVAA